MNYNKEIAHIVNEIKEELVKCRIESKATKKDIQILVEGFFSNNFKEVQGTKLYNKHGGEYCSALEIINDMDRNGKFYHTKYYFNSRKR